MKTKDRKFRMPMDSGGHHVGLLDKLLALHIDVVIRLNAIRQEGIDDYDLDCDEDEWRLQMLDECIAEWQKGADGVEAEMEAVLLWMVRSGCRDRADAMEDHHWKEYLPAEPRLTKAYAKAMKSHLKALAEDLHGKAENKAKAKALALKGLEEAQEALNG